MSLVFSQRERWPETMKIGLLNLFIRDLNI